jgi:hypothetical protein
MSAETECDRCGGPTPATNPEAFVLCESCNKELDDE